MQNRIIDTAKHTMIYGIGNISTKIIGLLLLPLYTAKLSVLNYGKFTILEVTSQILVIIISMNISSAMLRWCSSESSEKEQNTIISTSFFSLLVMIGLFLCISIPFSDKLSMLYFQTNDYYKYFIVMFVSVSFEILNGVPLSILRFQERSKLYNIIIIIRVSIVLVLNITFLTVIKTGIIGIFASYLIAQVIVFIILIPKLYVRLRLSFNITIFREMANYSLPLILSSLSMLLLSVGDRFIISHFMQYSDVGIYSLAYKIAGVINVLVIQSFAMGYLPIAYKMLSDPNAKMFYQRIFKYYSYLLVLVALIISIFARELLEVVAKQQDYWIAYQFVPILALTFIAKGLQYIFALGFHYVKKTKYNAIIIIIGVVINIILNFILIPRWSLWGAGISTLFSTLLITNLVYHYSSKLYKIKYHTKRLILLLIGSIIIYCFSMYFGNQVFWIRVFLKLVLIAVFILGTIFFYLNSEEQKKFKRKIMLVFERSRLLK